VAGCALYVVHVSCQEAVEPIALAAEKGWNVFGETCTQYFFVDYTFLEKPDFEGREVRLHAASAGQGEPGDPLGRGANDVSRRSRRPLRLPLGRPESRSARTTSRRSRTAGRGSRTGCT
jgi:hypothetical protein